MSDPWESNARNGNEFVDVGPQPDGTYGVPSSAVQTNAPANTAGYSSQTPGWVGDVLKTGIGAVAGYFNNANILDYRRFEATNGGLYRQGYPALISRNGQAQMNPTLFWALIIGGAFLLLKKG